MAAVKAGSREAFRTVVELHQSQVYAFCVRFLGDEALARDATQEVFISLWNERASYDERGKLKVFLFSIARRRCLAAAKKRRSYHGLEEALSAAGESERVTEPAAESVFAATSVHRALASMPAKYAEVVILRHLEGFELKEIAEIAGLRLGTVKSRLGRGLAALREELTDAS